MKSIVFVDPPAFCATVERLAAPALRSRPIAVAPPGADRATILALSPEAQAAGITRGMLVRRARKLCPDLVLLPPNPRLYARASRALHEILRIYAPVIEPRGFGHSFLDLTGTERLFGPAVDVAERIRREARERLRLPLSAGVAVNKLVSEAATRVGRKDGKTEGRTEGGGVFPSFRLSVCPPGDEAPFLAPNPMSVLPDVPDDIRERLDEYQLERIGQVAAISETELCAVAASTRGRCCRRKCGPSTVSPTPSPPTPTTLACCTACSGGSPRRWAAGSGGAASRRGGSHCGWSTPTTTRTSGASRSPRCRSTPSSGRPRSGRWRSRWGGGRRCAR